MKLKLQDAVRKSEYHYKGTVKLTDLAEAFKGYHFSEEVLAKAAIHKGAMMGGISPFHVTVRIDPGSTVDDMGEICFSYGELRDGKSKTAAACQMAKEELEGYEVQIDLFLVTKEKMDKLEANRL